MSKNTLCKKIEKVQSQSDSQIRDYIGASGIGAECLRQIWYEFKGFKAESVPRKIRRTWAIGKHLEGLIIRWLIDAGLDIATTWVDLQAEKMPFFKGHLDYVWMKKDKAFAIIEIKTAKDTSFNLFVKKGLRIWNSQYYAQVQSYMGMSGIHTAYIFVLNKDNSEIADELIIFDEIFYNQLCEKAKMIANAEIAPPKINNSPLWFTCKMCKFNKICHK